MSCKLTLCCTVNYKEQQQVNNFQIHELRFELGFEKEFRITSYYLAHAKFYLMLRFNTDLVGQFAMKSFSYLLTFFLLDGFIISSEALGMY